MVCIINLLVMHYTLISTCDVDKALVPIDFVDNFVVVVVEGVLLTALFSLFSWGRLRIALFLSVIVTCLWSFSNVAYSRFFFQYIPFSAFSESGNMLDPFMLKCLIDGLKWQDFYFVLALVLSMGLYRKAPEVRITLMFSLRRLALFGVGVVCIVLFMHFAFNPTFKINLYFRTLYSDLFTQWHYTNLPFNTNFQRGSMRNLLFAFSESLFSDMELTEEQRKKIREELQLLRPLQSTSSHEVNPKIKNVIVLLVESYMSFSIDMEVNGREVTPFLNSLVRDSSIYYNGHMKSNITIGESSDGQFIYMTGLLPLRSEVTVSKAKKHELIGLPAVLSERMGMETRMVVPTSASFWSQDVLCDRYGIQHLYSRSDYKNVHQSFLSDDQIFELADSVDALSNNPFFSIVLTFSMHKPYTEAMDSAFVTDVSSRPSTMNNYLNVCHFTDAQIKKYFDSLKRRGLYDNSLIVIVADHDVGENQLQLSSEVTERELPLFIINGNINRNETWNGKCNQLDVYTTILDVLGIDSPWKGLGHTLLNKDYVDSILPVKWDMSEWMITGDWFSSAGQDATALCAPKPAQTPTP